jgi:SAM-dependent methyltransferase
MEAEINASGGKLGGCWLPFDAGTSHPDLIRWLVGVFPIRTVLDIGSGGGEALRLFRAYGCHAIGVEGLKYAASRSHMPTIVHDMEAGPIRVANIDLVYSVEFVEHVNNVDATIESLCNGKMIAMSHALEGQGGHHHVQCHNDEYWQAKVEAKGYRYLKRLSIEHARPRAGGYFGQSGMLFLREDCYDAWGLARGDYE